MMRVRQGFSSGWRTFQYYGTKNNASTKTDQNRFCLQRRGGSQQGCAQNRPCELLSLQKKKLRMHYYGHQYAYFGWLLNNLGTSKKNECWRTRKLPYPRLQRLYRYQKQILSIWVRNGLLSPKTCQYERTFGGFHEQ